MSLKDSIKRLRSNSNDKTALAEFFNHFEGFIHSLINQYKSTIYGMNEEDIEQELKLKLLKTIDRVDLQRDDKEIAQYFLNTLRNQITILHRKAVPKEEALAPTLDQPIDDEEGRNLEEMLESGERGILEALEFPDMLSKAYAKVSPFSRSIIELLLEGWNKEEIQEKLHQQRVDELTEKYKREKGKAPRDKELLAISEGAGPSKKSILRAMENEIMPALKELGFTPGREPVTV